MEEELKQIGLLLETIKGVKASERGTCKYNVTGVQATLNNIRSRCWELRKTKPSFEALFKILHYARDGTQIDVFRSDGTLGQAEDELLHCKQLLADDKPDNKENGLRVTRDTKESDKKTATSSTGSGNTESRSEEKRRLKLEEKTLEHVRHQQDQKEAHSRLSMKMKEGNPNITDISDANRPTKLAERFSQIYDDEWSDAFEDLIKTPPLQADEKKVVDILLRIVLQAKTFCESTAGAQIKSLKKNLGEVLLCENIKERPPSGSATKHTQDSDTRLEAAVPSLIQARKEVADLSLPNIKWLFLEKVFPNVARTLGLPKSNGMERYINKCVELTWLMSVQDPPMHLHTCNKGDKQQSTLFREYNKKGTVIEACVWPALFIEEGGAQMAKGVAMHR